MVHHTSKRVLIVVDSCKINSSSQTADIAESTDLEEGKTIADVDNKGKSEWLNSQELEGFWSVAQCLYQHPLVVHSLQWVWRVRASREDTHPGRWC